MYVLQFFLTFVISSLNWDHFFNKKQTNKQTHTHTYGKLLSRAAVNVCLQPPVGIPILVVIPIPDEYDNDDEYDDGEREREEQASTSKPRTTPLRDVA